MVRGPVVYSACTATIAALAWARMARMSEALAVRMKAPCALRVDALRRRPPARALPAV